LTNTLYTITTTTAAIRTHQYQSILTLLSGEIRFLSIRQIRILENKASAYRAKVYYIKFYFMSSWQITK